MLFIDQTHRKINIPAAPKKIISLVPSTTELLFDLGLDQHIIGVTRFCIFPATARKEKTVIGGTKNLKLDKIRKLQPDLIIADKEENTKEQIEALAKEFPVWISNIRKFDDALEMIQTVGDMTGTSSLAQKMVTEIQQAFTKIKMPIEQKSIAYFIWQDPLMVVGTDTFIHAMLRQAGFKNAFAHHSRYPAITEKKLQDAKPDIIFLSSEPYPFAEKHKLFFQKMLPNTKVMLVDGTYFSWYGSRMIEAAFYFQKIQQKIATDD